MSKILIGAGGHAAVVYEIAQQNKVFFDAFIDPLVTGFKDLKKMAEDNFTGLYFLGIGGSTIGVLMKRHLVYKQYKDSGYKSFALVSSHSYVSKSATIGQGTLISHHAVIQAGAKIGENVIINTGAIVEHDVIVEDGCHIAPGAIVLGGAKISSCAMVGAGAVVLPNQVVSSQNLVSSLTRYKNDH